MYSHFPFNRFSIPFRNPPDSIDERILVAVTSAHHSCLNLPAAVVAVQMQNTGNDDQIEADDREEKRIEFSTFKIKYRVTISQSCEEQKETKLNQ